MFTSRADGDLSVLRPGPGLPERRQGIVAGPWSWFRQVHGAGVVRVDRPGARAGEEADAAITDTPGAVLAVHTADCVPLSLTAATMVGVAHVGWRGLMAGVVEQTVGAMRALGGDVALRAEIGPCIRPRCYDFGAADLSVIAATYGSEVRSRTATGDPALDLAAGVTAALERVGVRAPLDSGTCTACSPVHWSFRAGRDAERQALVAWIEP